MANTIIGKIFVIGEIFSTPTSRGGVFEKRDVILDCSTFDQRTGEKKESFVKLEMSGSHVHDAEAFQVGTEVQMSFVLEGRAWLDPKSNTVKYFNTVKAYKVEMSPYQQQPQMLGQQPQQIAQPQVQTAKVGGYEQQMEFMNETLKNAADSQPKPQQNDDLPF